MPRSLNRSSRRVSRSRLRADRGSAQHDSTPRSGCIIVTIMIHQYAEGLGGQGEYQGA